MDVIKYKQNLAVKASDKVWQYNNSKFVKINAIQLFALIQ